MHARAKNFFTVLIPDVITMGFMALRNRVKASRSALGISQSELARRVGVSSAAINHLESGRTAALKAETLIRLAAALQVSAYWLEHGSGAATPDARLTPDESEVMALYHALSEGRRLVWLSTGRALLAESPNHKPSVADPFKRPAKARR